MGPQHNHDTDTRRILAERGNTMQDDTLQTPTPTKVRGVRLDNDTDARLAFEAKRRNMTQARLMQSILKHWIDPQSVKLER